MARKTLTKVFVVVGTPKNDERKPWMVFGAPGIKRVNYPQNQTFITSDEELAEKYAKEMNGAWGSSVSYKVEERMVRV
jgi:hypothetical protein